MASIGKEVRQPLSNDRRTGWSGFSNLDARTDGPDNSDRAASGGVAHAFAAPCLVISARNLSGRESTVRSGSRAHKAPTATTDAFSERQESLWSTGQSASTAFAPGLPFPLPDPGPSSGMLALEGESGLG